MLFVVSLFEGDPKIRLLSKGRPILGAQKGDPGEFQDVGRARIQKCCVGRKNKMDGSEKVPKTELSRIDQNE